MLLAIAALSVFVLPEDILDVSAACADFVKFMKRFFPNIVAIGKISPHTQLAEFYVAALRIGLAGFFVISRIFIPTSSFLYDKKEPRGVKTQLLYFSAYL